MSLNKIRNQFPGEVLPTHYEVRSIEYPSYYQWMGRQVGEGNPHNVVHGTHDNLLDALRQQSRLEIERRDAEYGHVTPDLSNDYLDVYSSHLTPTIHGFHPSTPHIYAVYPDKSYIHVDFPDFAYTPNGQYIDPYNNDIDNANLFHHANMQTGSKHHNLIEQLVRAGRNVHLTGPDNKDVKALREQALKEHDLTPLLLAADSMEEQHPHLKDEADKLRAGIRDSQVMGYKLEAKVVKYYRALKSLLNRREE